MRERHVLVRRPSSKPGAFRSAWAWISPSRARRSSTPGSFKFRAAYNVAANVERRHHPHGLFGELRPGARLCLQSSRKEGDRGDAGDLGPGQDGRGARVRRPGRARRRARQEPGRPGRRASPRSIPRPSSRAPTITPWSSKETPLSDSSSRLSISTWWSLAVGGGGLSSGIIQGLRDGGKPKDPGGRRGAPSRQRRRALSRGRTHRRRTRASP